MTRRLALLLALTVALLVSATPVAAHGGAKKADAFPAKIDLPVGFQPEGITAGRGNTFFVGSLANGAIYRGNFRTGAGAILVPGSVGLKAVGTEYERRHNRLWVAGGETHQVRVYNATTGALLATYTLPGGFLNDLVATRNAIYVTDSNNAQLGVIPLGAGGALPAQSAVFVRPLIGVTVLPPPAFNLNGIAWTGRWLIVVQGNLGGRIFRVDPATGVATQLALSGGSAENGDGIEIQGRTIYVVRNVVNRVAVFRANRNFTAATWKFDITAAAGLLSIPTTGVVEGRKVWVVNSQFGHATPATAPYWITRLSAKS